jgi:organic hydroperoxide reductase OsmC/OhrA
MTNSNDHGAPRPQAVVAGDFDGAATLNGRAGASVFSIDGPDGRGGPAAGANPYELLSASLAACTAMTIRLQAGAKRNTRRRVNGPAPDMMEGSHGQSTSALLLLLRTRRKSLRTESPRARGGQGRRPT